MRTPRGSAALRVAIGPISWWNWTSSRPFFYCSPAASKAVAGLEFVRQFGAVVGRCETAVRLRPQVCDEAHPLIITLHGREPLVPMRRVLKNLPAQPKRFSHNTRTTPNQSATADAGPNALHWLGG